MRLWSGTQFSGGFCRIPFMKTQLERNYWCKRGFMEQFQTKIEPSMHLVCLQCTGKGVLGVQRRGGNISRYFVSILHGVII
jgi:hypothetical protein